MCRPVKKAVYCLFHLCILKICAAFVAQPMSLSSTLDRHSIGTRRCNFWELSTAMKFGSPYRFRNRAGRATFWKTVVLTTESSGEGINDANQAVPTKVQSQSKNPQRKRALFAISMLKNSIPMIAVASYVAMMLSLDLLFSAVGPYPVLFCFGTTIYLWSLNKFRYGGRNTAPPEKAMFPAKWVRPYSYFMAVLSLLIPVSCMFNH
jgi:hypothetical protein